MLEKIMHHPIYMLLIFLFVLPYGGFLLNKQNPIVGIIIIAMQIPYLIGVSFKFRNK